MVSLFILIPIGILAVSTASIFIKLCDAPALMIATYRMVFASLILVPFALHKKKGTGWGRKDIGGILILAGILIALGRQVGNPMGDPLPSSKKGGA